MPELAEIHFASRLINHVASGTFFRSPIVKSNVSKMKDLNWNSNKFTIQSRARGKELQMTLTDVSDGNDQSKPDNAKTLTLTFGFGMSGKFSFDRFDKIPKHAHLQFFTTETPANVLSFVDYRRFGKWDVRDFDLTRGPDPVLDPKEFRRKVLTDLKKSLFERAICEVILDQRYFNGVGNYLRAEILFRAKIPPFTNARSVLTDLPIEHEIDPNNPDLLDLCTLVPKEVFGFSKPGEGYQPDSQEEIYIPFRNWLRCYMKPGMNNLVDRFNRTMWFSGSPGPMVPTKQFARHSGKRQKKEADLGEDDDKNPEEKKEEGGGPSTSKKRRSAKSQKDEEAALPVDDGPETDKNAVSSDVVDVKLGKTRVKNEKKGLAKPGRKPTGGKKVVVSKKETASGKETESSKNSGGIVKKEPSETKKSPVARKVKSEETGHANTSDGSKNAEESRSEVVNGSLNSGKSQKKKTVPDQEDAGSRRRSTRIKKIK